MSEHRCWVYGDNVNTDVIFPGKYTYTVTDPDGIRAHALEDLDPTFANNVQVGDVIIAGENWGCGSSREQAVTTLKYAGVHAIIAASISRIYYRNCINQGLLPIIVPDLHQLVKTGDTINITDTHIIAAGQTFPHPTLSPTVAAILQAGGLVPMLQQQFASQEHA